MDFFDILKMIGGLALFLYGMETMGKGLSQMSGGKLERILEKLTASPWKAVLLGAGVTAVIQSSSATTVMVVGFVNSGIMKLTQAVGIIMGANIGTTITSWILSLSGIESSNFFLQILKPSSFSPVLAAVGIILLMFAKGEKKKDAGMILMGFAILMTGMDTMSSAVKPLADVPEFTGILTMFSHPLLGMLGGAVLTAVIQSSSASVGILQALCATGAVSFGTAVPIILGQNIGTCVTAVLSGIGANRNAKRTALVHLYFNLVGTLVFMTVFYGSNWLWQFDFLENPVNAAGIAAVHTVFNLSAAIVLLPFSGLLVRLACLTVPDSGNKSADRDEDAKELKLLDVRFLDTPGYAVELSRLAAVKMVRLARAACAQSVELLTDYQEEKAMDVERLEELVDHYEDALGSYLVELSRRDQSERDSRTISMLLHCIGDFERISDHAVNLMESAKELHQKRLGFSPKAEQELRVFSGALLEILERSADVFEREDLEGAVHIEPLEELMDELSRKLRKRHVERLRMGECTIELGFVLSDLITNYERISDHCSNTAIALLQSQGDGQEAHEYTAGFIRRKIRNFSVITGHIKRNISYRKQKGKKERLWHGSILWKMTAASGRSSGLRCRTAAIR